MVTYMYTSMIHFLFVFFIFDILHSDNCITFIDFALTNSKNNRNGIPLSRIPHGTRSAGVYYCDYCEYSTRVSTHFHNHVRRHTGERPYCCPVCHQRFSVKSSMLRHLHTQHTQYL
ncbi:Ras-responsive element-binding protein 1, partial [Stegodyphus mimosarum]